MTTQYITELPESLPSRISLSSPTYLLQVHVAFYLSTTIKIIQLLPPSSYQYSHNYNLSILFSLHFSILCFQIDLLNTYCLNKINQYISYYDLVKFLLLLKYKYLYNDEVIIQNCLWVSRNCSYINTESSKW